MRKNRKDQQARDDFLKHKVMSKIFFISLIDMKAQKLGLGYCNKNDH